MLPHENIFYDCTICTLNKFVVFKSSEIENSNGLIVCFICEVDRGEAEKKSVYFQFVNINTF